MDDIPYGYCHCGCGGKTPICTQNHAVQGLVKGEPRRFIFNHHRRRHSEWAKIREEIVRKGVKECLHCLVTKPLSEFYKKKGNAYGAVCKLCYALEGRATYVRRVKVKEAKRSLSETSDVKRTRNLRNRLQIYGFTEAQYWEAYNKQDGCCAICNSKESRLLIDHCHKTGALRGLLCRRCNIGLGMFEDNIESMNKAILYLQDTNSHASPAIPRKQRHLAVKERRKNFITPR